jgi:hypothetical protein
MAVGMDAVLRNPATPIFEAEQFSRQISEHVDSLNQLLQKAAKGAQTTTPADPQDLVDASVAVASDLARYSFHSQPTRSESAATASDKSLAEAIRNARAQLGKSAATLKPMLQGTSPAPFETQLAKDYASSVADLAAQISRSPRSTGVKPLVAPAGTAGPIDPGAILTGRPEDPIPQTTRRLLAEGVVATQPFYNSAATSLQALQAYLVARLEQEAMKTHCSQLDSVLEVPEPQPVYTNELGLTQVGILARSANSLSSTLSRLVQSCFCNALIPPCPSCDDRGVLLACVTLEDCKVKDICNLDRQFVLSPVTIRYWIPEISRIGRAIERACCPDPCETERRQTEPNYVRSNPDVELARTMQRLLILSCGESTAYRRAVTDRISTKFSVGRFAPDSFISDFLQSSSPLSAQAESAAATVGDPRTISEISARLKKIQADTKKLQAALRRLSPKRTRPEKKNQP